MEVLQRLSGAGLAQDAEKAGNSNENLHCAVLSVHELDLIQDLSSSLEAGSQFWESLLDAHINVSSVGR